MTPQFPPRICAVHPSNHLIVQELLLHTALGGQYFTSGERQSYFKLAKHIAKLPTACGPSLVAGVLPRCGPLSVPWRHAAAHRVAFERACQQQQKQKQQQRQQQQQGQLEQEGVGQIHRNNRAAVYYDDARTHEHCLGDLLSSHNFEVALIGKLRCGCPAAKRAHFLLTNDFNKNLSLLTHEENKRFEERSAALLFARAIKGVEACGYLKVIGRRRLRECGVRTTRYVCIARQPIIAPDFLPSGNNDGMQELFLSWSPSWCFHVRKLFLTGPDPFVAHLMLLAHKRGYELSQDGMYTQSEGIRKLVSLNSEEDIFTKLQIPYVNPFHRYAYCRLHNLL
ncbi:DNA polymerase beta [Trypanosoma melophagium]|uniref:DNA polymerase beta n=1 Tax=Trypanosoma melophagium TaxID=715481 RepID=UPI00351A444A|nr:DNA polymerase beta [Trypanosoma melophagium]